ncbi:MULTISPECIES: tetratricopeptide repeat protein [Hyphobacterium]|uniref:FlgO domain-containing protein n=1 Tax=Hyphobacterium vulgare TaxID=1736751 RepID=A0ABV7A0Q7_9PROT
MGSFINELRRRGVIRAIAGYLVAAWLVLQVVAAVENAAGLPSWSDGLALIALIVGFPIVVFMAWSFDLTPDGLRPTAVEGMTAEPTRTLDYVMFAAIAVFCGLIAWQLATRPALFTGQRPGDTVALVTPASAGPPATVEVAPPPELSVAVLPFAAFSASEDDGYFADGLTEEILNSLASLPDLLVTSRTSAFQFKGPDVPPIPEIARSLNVAHVLEGSVRRSGDRVRVTTQLIRASDDRHLWSQTYDRSLDDVFAIQEEIAEAVAAVLEIVLDEEARRQMRNSGTRSFEAFIAYQRALELWEDAHIGGDFSLLDEADPLFAAATEQSPDFFQAWLLRSDRNSHRMIEMSEAPEPVDDAVWIELETQRVAMLDAAMRTAETQAQRSIVAANQILFESDWTHANTIVFDSLASEDCLNDNWLQTLIVLYPDLDQRLAYAERLLVCDPLNPEAQLFHADTLIARGDYEAALSDADRLLEMDQIGESEMVRLDALMGLERYDEARAMLDENWLWENYRLDARLGNADALSASYEELSAEGDWSALIVNAIAGRREEANAVAARMDARPLGAVSLIDVIIGCGCGAPFDLEATPNFAARIEAGGLAWPPPADLGFPLMDAAETP